ncbi:hypothetical protein H8D30_01300 [bacterium]|nr:hypothetical protein [bacterium]
MDTAVLISWNERPLSAGTTALFHTQYGLAGIDIQGGELAVALTAPALLPPHRSGAPRGLAVGYVENTSGFISRNTSLSLTSPDGLTVLGGSVSVGDLDPGETRQVTWEIRNPSLESESARVVLKATSATLKTNLITRRVGLPRTPVVSLIPQPIAEIVARGIHHSPGVVTTALTIKNESSVPSPEGEVMLTLEGPATLESQPRLVFPALSPGKEIKLRWTLRPRPEGDGVVALRWLAQHPPGKTVQSQTGFVVPPLPSHLRLTPLPSDRESIATTVVTGVKLPPFVRLHRSWQLPVHCLYAGKGGIESLENGYHVDVQCDGNRLVLVIEGEMGSVPPLINLLRVYHPLGGDGAWILESECLDVGTGACENLEEE